MTKSPASEKQITFLTKLAAERVTPSVWEANLPAALKQGLNTLEASLLITQALTFPKKPAADAPKVVSPLAAALASIPKSKYALPFELVSEFIPGVRSNGNDYLFVETREYMKRLYIRRLVGAPGDFSRYSIPTNAAVSLVNLIAQDPQKYAQKFGELFTVCGCCAAPLTDELSRELHLGPECRKRFGL